MDVGFENGDILLDQHNGVYYAGQVINGNVQFKLEQHVNITAINIEFLGEARVLWSEEEKEVRHGQSFKTRVDYRGLEQYFNDVQCLAGGHGIQQLKPGPHSLPFQFQIPHSVPSTFKGEKGEVAYEIRVFMEFPEQMKPRGELAKLFEVIAPLDLNKADPEIAQPLQLSFEEMYSCGCSCSPSPVTIEVGLPATGFCPRQAVPVTVDVRNDANIEVKTIDMEIVSKNRYHSQQPVAAYSTPEQKLVAHSTGAVLGRTERHFACHLRLPDMIAPNLANCRIIDVEYYFKVSIKLSGCNEDLEDATQIYIGLVPLEHLTSGTEYVHPLADRLPAGPIPEFQPQINQMNQINYTPNNAYQGYPNTPAYPTPYPNAGYPTPNYQIGFTDAQAPNQQFAQGYPMQNMGYNGYPQTGQNFMAPGYNPMAPSAPNY